MPWATGNPPFDQTGHMTYPSFFADPAAVAHYKLYRGLPADKPFAPAPDQNWESQHPPLYYLLMAPFMKLTERFSFVTQIFILRLSSYLLAWAGFIAGWGATRSYEGKRFPRGVAAGYLYYPFVVPMFFGEFARIGNDSLCPFLLGLIFSVSLSTFYRGERDLRRPLALGVLLGLGLLTKAFFIPVIAGYAVFMLLRAWQARHDTALLRQRVATLMFAVIPALLIGGGWYVYDFIDYGSPIGSIDSVILAHHGGLIANLRQNFSAYLFVRDMIGIVVSWSWGGSWSLVVVIEALTPNS